MPGTSARTGFHDLWYGSQSSFRGIERINQQLIESEICDNGKAIVRRKRDGVGVRSFLPLGIYARAFMLHARVSLPQPAIFQHREQAYASPGVVGNQGVLSRPI